MAKQVLRVAQEHPGASIQFIADQLRCGHSRVAYHATTLERKNVLRKERDGIFVRNYACTSSGQRTWERLLPHLRDRRRRVLVEQLVAEPRREWNMHQLATRAGLAYTSMLTAMRVLRDQGFLHVEQSRTGRYKIRATEVLPICFAACHRFLTEHSVE